MTSLAERQIVLIEEQWKTNHIEAMQCWDFEDLLLYCIEAFNRIGRKDEVWRTEMLAGRLEYDPRHDEEIDRLYRLWLGLCRSIADELPRFEQRFVHLTNGDEFRRCLSEVQSILGDEDEFFTDPNGRMAELRDEAIEWHRRTRAEPE